MMKTNDELFTLIKSMDKNEKGYFKKASKLYGSHKDGNYLKLFDCIAAMDEYSDTLVRKKFEGEKFINQLGVTKNYLKTLIVRTLRNYYNENDPEIGQSNTLSEIMVLRNKQLYDSALKLIQKEKKAAQDSNSYPLLMSLLQQECNIIVRNISKPGMLRMLQERLMQEQECLQLYENLRSYKKLQADVLSIVTVQGHAGGGRTGEVLEILKNPLLMGPEMAMSFKAKVLRCETLSRCYMKIGDIKRAQIVAIELVELFRENPIQVQLAPYNYFAVLTTLFNRFIPGEPNSRSYECITELERLLLDRSLKLSGSNRYHMTVSLYEFKLKFYSKTFAFDKGIEVDKSLQAFARKNALLPHYELTTGFFSAICYLGAGQIETALKRVNELTNGHYDGIREDTMLGLYTVNLIIHYELGNYILLKGLLKKITVFMRQHNFDRQGGENFEKLFREIVEAKVMGNNKKLKEHFRMLLRDVESYWLIDSVIAQWWAENNLNNLVRY